MRSGSVWPLRTKPSSESSTGARGPAYRGGPRDTSRAAHERDRAPRRCPPTRVAPRRSLPGEHSAWSDRRRGGARRRAGLRADPRRPRRLRPRAARPGPALGSFERGARTAPRYRARECAGGHDARSGRERAGLRAGPTAKRRVLGQTALLIVSPRWRFPDVLSEVAALGRLLVAELLVLRVRLFLAFALTLQPFRIAGRRVGHPLFGRGITLFFHAGGVPHPLYP